MTPQEQARELAERAAYIAETNIHLGKTSGELISDTLHLPELLAVEEAARAHHDAPETADYEPCANADPCGECKYCKLSKSLRALDAARKESQ